MAENHSTVEYRDIPGHPGYRIGDDGSVWTRWGKRMLAAGRGSEGCLSDTWRAMKLGRQTDRNNPNRSYMQVRLSTWNGTRTKLFRVHRLVLEAFTGPCPDGMVSRHLDGNPANNRLDNLCWGTPTENTEDKRDHGRHGSRFYTHEGQTLILKDWAKLKGIKYLTLWNRLNSGMPFADAISLKRYDRKGIKRSKH